MAPPCNGLGGSIAVMPRMQRFGVMEAPDGVDVLVRMGDEGTQRRDEAYASRIYPKIMERIREATERSEGRPS